jgi:FkbM family methyltransferase
MPINAAAIRLVFRAWRYRYKLNRLEIERMLQLIPRGGVGVDIGAHKGAYTYWMARRVGRSGRVFAFEPQPRLAAPLARTFAAMRLPQVSVIEMAASSSTADGVPMSVRRHSTHGAALDRFEGPDVDVVAVKTISVDDFIAGQSPPRLDFIKIDAEGHELSILEGALEALRRFRPAVLAEIEVRHHPGAANGANPIEQVVHLLAGLGYQCEFPFNGSWHPVSAFDAATHQTYGQGEYANNFLFTATDR